MTQTLDLAYPFTGRWLVQNSPAERVPSHGTWLFATAYALDFVPVDERGRTAPITLGSIVRAEPPERFPGFGRSITAPAAGVVATVSDGDPDHDAFRGLPSIGYALTQRRRVARGWTGLAGNHVVIEVGPGAYVALCHLRRGSVRVGVGDVVGVGEELARCGNSGNSTEPHVHVQVMTGPDPQHADALRVTFGGRLPRNGEVVDLP